MAKKKVATKEKKDLEDMDDDLFGDEDIESHYPDVAKIKSESPKKTSPASYDDEELEEEEEFLDEDFMVEEMEPEITYKYLDLSLSTGTGENDYSLSVHGQSHGFLNILVKKLLTLEGVNAAAYKVTQIDPPELFVRLEKGFDIKKILHEAISLLRDQVNETKKAFNKIM
jgi:DNA-directed RNA polymerase subunit L